MKIPFLSYAEDCTEALQAAINAAVSAGEVLYIPAGVYRVDGTLTVAEGTATANVAIEGAHHGSTSLVGNGAGNAVLEIKGSGTRLALRRLHINGNSSKTHALYLNGTLTTDSVLEDLRLQPGSLSNLGVSADAVALSGRWYDISVNGGKYGLWIESLTSIQNTKIYNFRASNTGSGDGSGAAIYSRNTTSGQPNIEFHGATIEGNNGRALDHRGGGHIRFVGGHCENNCKIDNTDTVGEYEIGGAIDANTVVCNVTWYSVRFGQTPSGKNGPRVRIMSSHSWPVLDACVTPNAYRVLWEDSTSTGSQGDSRSMTRPTVEYGTGGAPRWVHTPAPVGSTTISDANSTATVSITSWKQHDASYIPVLTIVDTSGTPAAGSTRAWATGRSTTQFTINLEAAPGVGNSVTVGWTLQRVSL